MRLTEGIRSVLHLEKPLPVDQYASEAHRIFLCGSSDYSSSVIAQSVYFASEAKKLKVNPRNIIYELYQDEDRLLRIAQSANRVHENYGIDTEPDYIPVSPINVREVLGFIDDRLDACSILGNEGLRILDIYRELKASSTRFPNPGEQILKAQFKMLYRKKFPIIDALGLEELLS